SFVLSLLSYVATVAFVVVGGILVATYWHTEAFGTCLIFGGATVIVATLIRPAFFWRTRNVKFIRSLLGERGAAAFCLVVGAGIALVGIDRVVYKMDATAECARLAAEALDSHQRMRVLQSRPNVARTKVLALPGTPLPKTCDQYLHYDAF
ncbi:MAG TPA: hypothetical protein VNG95_06355, partial [Gemmatimonadales bacterium]|nr:hypothetical protein [Gemmatimonadales bacterium]